MTKKTLHGHVEPGCKDAKNWGIDDIRKATGWGHLKPGTLNVRLDAPHTLRADFHLPRGQREDGREEDLDFEPCWLVIGDGQKVKALIARTSTNYWKDSVLEIMAEVWLRECYGLEDGNAVAVEVWVGPSATAEAQQETSGG